MLISYNDESDVYRIDLMYPETTIYIKANDIADARRMFIERMKWLFDEAVNTKLNMQNPTTYHVKQEDLCMVNSTGGYVYTTDTKLTDVPTVNIADAIERTKMYIKE